MSAVAVPDGTRDILPNGDLGEDQPRVWVADRSSTVLSKGRWAWFDLAAVLCTDIPWWPLGLTNVDAMAAW